MIIKKQLNNIDNKINIRETVIAIVIAIVIEKEIVIVNAIIIHIMVAVPTIIHHLHHLHHRVDIHRLVTVNVLIKFCLFALIFHDCHHKLWLGKLNQHDKERKSTINKKTNSSLYMSFIKNLWNKKKNAFFVFFLFPFSMCFLFFVSVKKFPLEIFILLFLLFLCVHLFSSQMSFLPIITYKFESRCSMSRTH